MDRLLGSIIDDYTLYRIIEGIIIILILITIYLGVQIVMTLKFPKTNSNDISSQKKYYIRSSIFIFITGFFMLIHELAEGLEKDVDYATYEMFELIAFLGLVFLLNEWRKILKSQKK